MKRPAYVEVCDIEEIDFVQMIVSVQTEDKRELQFPIVYSGIVSDAVDYAKLKAFIIYSDVNSEGGIAILVPNGLLNSYIAPVSYTHLTLPTICSV